MFKANFKFKASSKGGLRQKTSKRTNRKKRKRREELAKKSGKRCQACESQR